MQALNSTESSRSSLPRKKRKQTCKDAMKHMMPMAVLVKFITFPMTLCKRRSAPGSSMILTELD